MECGWLFLKSSASVVSCFFCWTQILLSAASQLLSQQLIPFSQKQLFGRKQKEEAEEAEEVLRYKDLIFMNQLFVMGR